jgi:hypothetical protein
MPDQTLRQSLATGPRFSASRRSADVGPAVAQPREIRRFLPADLDRPPAGPSHEQFRSGAVLSAEACARRCDSPVCLVSPLGAAACATATLKTITLTEKQVVAIRCMRGVRSAQPGWMTV